MLYKLTVSYEFESHHNGDIDIFKDEYLVNKVIDDKHYMILCHDYNRSVYKWDELNLREKYSQDEIKNVEIIDAPKEFVDKFAIYVGEEIQRGKEKIWKMENLLKELI